MTQQNKALGDESNLRIITIFGQEFLNNKSWGKTLSKLQRPETGVKGARFHVEYNVEISH